MCCILDCWFRGYLIVVLLCCRVLKLLLSGRLWSTLLFSGVADSSVPIRPWKPTSPLSWMTHLSIISSTIGWPNDIPRFFKQRWNTWEGTWKLDCFTSCIKSLVRALYHSRCGDEAIRISCTGGNLEIYNIPVFFLFLKQIPVMFEIRRDGLPIKRDLEKNQTTAPVAKVEGGFRETHDCFI